MEEVMVTDGEIEEVEEYALELSEESKLVKINNNKEYEQEGTMLKSVKKKYKEVNDKLNELLKPFQESKKKSQEGMNKLKVIFAKPLDLLKEAEVNIKQALLDYDQKSAEEERKEQKRIDDLAEKERKRLEKLAERQESKGNTEKAEETRERSVSMPAAFFIPTKRMKVKGISKRDNWIFVITDSSIIPREYLIPDEKKLDQVARAHKGTHQVPGVVFKNKPLIVSGT